MTFSDLQLVEPLLRAIQEEGYETPTPIQAQAIPSVLAGRDLLAIAQTGTGKTAAFALPILQRLSATPHGEGRRPIRALVLAPTRELATQIGDSLASYGRYISLRHAVVFGGVSQGPQTHSLARGIDILVATPGRLLDLMGQGLLRWDRLEILVLDEADRMLDMGFLPAVRRIIAVLPKRRQTLFFSATMGREPDALAAQILVKPERVTVTPPATTVEKVTQSVYFVEKSDKQDLLEHLLADATISRALVFTRTKHGADRVVQRLHRAGVDAAAIHANKSQGQRERALAGFKTGRTRVLVATDIAARGIDVDDISHVVNFDLPNIPESYVHRIGRTARAGAAGAALSFCDSSEREYLRDIEREIRQKVPVATAAAFRGGSYRPASHASSHGSTHAAAPRGTRPPTASHGGHGAGARTSHATSRPTHGAHRQGGHASSGQAPARPAQGGRNARIPGSWGRNRRPR